MNNIEGYGPIQEPFGLSHSFPQPAVMTDDQKQQVQTILSKYDPGNITAQNARDIFKQFMDADIKPGKDLRDAIKASGFDPHQLRTLAFQAVNASNPSSQDNVLTGDQKKQVQSILSRFDPKNLTAADAQSILKQLQQAGIKPGKDLVGTIQAAGFNTEQLASLAGPRDYLHPGHDGESPAQPQAHGINTTALDSLKAILSQYDLKNMSQDQQNNLISQLTQAGLLQSGDIINIGA